MIYYGRYEFMTEQAAEQFARALNLEFGGEVKIRQGFGTDVGWEVVFSTRSPDQWLVADAWSRGWLEGRRAE